MPILELRILPPLAVGRLGSSPHPLEAYDLVPDAQQPLGYRNICPRETLEVDEATGAIQRQYLPERIRFKDGEHIRPVAPFLEVFARTSEDVLEPLTLELLAQEGLAPADVKWSVDVGNIKAFRRTGDVNDRILASVRQFSDHEAHPLQGRCENFLPQRSLPLGSVRYIKPTTDYPEIRLRFTPAAGLVYGASTERHLSDHRTEHDCVLTPERILYDERKGRWRGYVENLGPTLTNPSQIYAGYDSDSKGGHVSWGYLDDECDGTVTVELTLAGGRHLRAHAHISAGPPTFAPDAVPIRTVSDELEQLLLGPERHGDVPLEEAEDILRRAFETVRLMNTRVMNGNTVDGRSNVASTMVRQDTNDFGRWYEPIMAPSIVDSLAVLALHERVFTALRSGAAPWFSEVLRRPEEIGDLSDKGRRKMPALMRGADGRALVLTRRQRETILEAARSALFQGPQAKGE